MIGTLNSPFAGMSLWSSPLNSTRSISQTSSGKPSFHAALNVIERRAGRPETLYEVLRVERNATPAEIKTAYRSLAKVYHPDSSDLKKQDDLDFIEIHNAYATLSDPEARQTYDLKWTTGARRKLGLHTTVGKRQGFYTCRRWETDQCW